ncbi:hypothetical protein M441DRAFT_29503 [Trichoderma asperellum CBS 433.97]|uniref:Fucose-specific lectin n=1 Tax=Trichoderma asperellum (strain ATCC 204424 / CBS 433.97 / NBRC 101777) TaxID=1042311 RepID=A0A2T3YZU9_TRIA4|nr:hypothetical protein M441DRAFT_29503 [Trichoderma asperellum CBS 433.97]PTB38099.1 hypothetical protein M441DRAFT_29503 [Trichoderma asperellum CBS 433.97]
MSAVGSEVKVDTGAAIEEQLPQRSPRRKRLWIIVAAVVLLLVVVAAVVGGVVGSRHQHKTTTASNSSNPSSDSSPTSSSTSSSTPSSTPSSTSPNAAYSSSSIAVTGWWTSTSSYSIRLFYQGKDEHLRLIGYDSTDGMWSTVTTLTGPTLRLGSPIAACNYNSTLYFSSAVTSTNNFTQIDIFYVDKLGQIQEWEVLEQKVPTVQTSNINGTISSLGLKPAANSRLATYWPSLIFQDELNQLQETYYTTSNKWLQNPLNLPSQNHSALVEVAYSTSSARQGGGNFIYQGDDQKLLAEGRSSSTASLKADAPTVSIPAESPIGAFSVPRNSQANSPMNTYTLWQNSTGGIQITWMDDDNGWQTTSTPDSFGSPDKGTDIACLTPSAYSLTPLQPKYDMARCYYLVDGRIREVKYDGSNWSVIGNVPLG